MRSPRSLGAGHAAQRPARQERGEVRPVLRVCRLMPPESSISERGMFCSPGNRRRRGTQCHRHPLQSQYGRARAPSTASQSTLGHRGGHGKCAIPKSSRRCDQLAQQCRAPCVTITSGSNHRNEAPGTRLCRRGSYVRSGYDSRRRFAREMDRSGCRSASTTVALLRAGEAHEHYGANVQRPGQSARLLGTCGPGMGQHLRLVAPQASAIRVYLKLCSRPGVRRLKW